MSDPPLERWKQFLRRDPTRWLLETDDPSILYWYQREIAHRPADAPGVRAAQERVLYSDAVQALFAAQDELGYWGDAKSLAQPYYRATLWNLVSLQELGVAPTSRRARNACEFILQNFWNDDKSFGSVNEVERGYLIGALAYFNFAGDERAKRAAQTLGQDSGVAENVTALWGLRAYSQTGELAAHIEAACGRVLNGIAEIQAANAPLMFPQFNPLEPLFVLRVLAAYDRAADPRAAPLVEKLIAKQDEHARWTPEADLNAQLLTPFERAGQPSRWVTLNALRVMTRLVVA